MEFTIFALPSLISFCISLCLAIYIFKIKPDDPINQLWTIFLLFVTMLTLGEFIVKIIGDDKELAIFWYKILIVPPGAFMPAVFLHFTFYYPERKTVLNYGFLPILLYSPYILLFLRAIFYQPSLDNLILSPNGYYSTLSLTKAVAGNIFLTHMILYGLYIFWGLFIWIKIYFSSSILIEKIRVKFLIAGATIFLGINFVINILLPESISRNFSEVTSITALIMAGLIVYAIVKYKLLTKVTLVTEDIPFKPIDYEIEPGYTYLIPEAEPNVGFQLFAKTVKSGAHGICITMNDPITIREKFGLKKTPIIWITKDETDYILSKNDILVKPENIASINEILNPFLDKSEESVIFLIDDKAITSGIKLHDHEKILNLSKTFFDTVVTANSSFIISVSPKSINQEKKLPIIKTKTPLLEFNRLSALVFEEICNNIIRFLIRNGYLKPEKVQTHLANLRKNDPFFKNISYRKSVKKTIDTNEIRINSFIEVRTLSKQIMIDKIKLFISEFEKIETAINLNSLVQSAINKYGLSKNEFQLHYGDTYIIPESDTRKSYEIFIEFISKEYKGLCITKSNPKKINRTYSLKNKGVQLYWLTDISSSKDYILPPKLEHILSAIEDYISSTPEKKIIILDGIEYLIFYSGDIFDAVLGFLRRLTDRISETNALVIIPLDPKALSEQRMTLLKRSGIEIYYPD